MWERIPPSFYLRKFRRSILHPVRRSKWEQYLRYREASRSFRRRLQSPASVSSNLLQHLTSCFTRYQTQPSPQTYRTLITFLFQTSRLHQIPRVLDHLENHEKFDLPESIFVNMINSYGVAHRIEDALHLFDRIPRLRCTRSVDSLDALLSALCRNREGLCRVPEVLSKCVEMNIRLESSTFQLLITALCRHGRIVHAMDILNCMIQDGSSLEIGESKEGCDLLEEALRSDLVMTGSSVDGIVCLLCEKKMICEAMQVVCKFYVANVGPSLKAWEALLFSSQIEPSSNIHNLLSIKSHS